MQTLATLLRPTSLDDYIGQTHIIGPNRPLRLAIQKKQPFSLIFWGPPGIGKTTLARIIAQACNLPFIELSAVNSGKKDIQSIVKDAAIASTTTILFLDEIHRFNKAQQDTLLPAVETGALILIGATTENPSFEVIAPLLSRCKIFTLQPLTSSEMNEIIDRAIQYLNTSKEFSPNIKDAVQIFIDEDTRHSLISISNGDARQCLNNIENTWNLYEQITMKTLAQTLQSKHLRFDKKGEEHYNTISAFIKSMRASNVDASLYYLARMIEGGEDPLFIARRMVIFASEDVGIAQPTALVVANAVFQAVTVIGYPEAQINLAHGVVYLAMCKKSRKCVEAYNRALQDVEKQGNLSIPLRLRNAPTKLMKEMGYAKDYEMYTMQSLLPDELHDKKYFDL